MPVYDETGRLAFELPLHEPSLDSVAWTQRPDCAGRMTSDGHRPEISWVATAYAATAARVPIRVPGVPETLLCMICRWSPETVDFWHGRPAGNCWDYPVTEWPRPVSDVGTCGCAPGCEKWRGTCYGFGPHAESVGYAVDLTPRE